MVIIGLTLATLTIRLAGVAIGQRLPRRGAWLRMLEALPGCLIIALLSVLLLQGGAREWLAGGLALIVAMISRSLLITMLTGIGAIWLLRTLV